MFHVPDVLSFWPQSSTSSQLLRLDARRRRLEAAQRARLSEERRGVKRRRPKTLDNQYAVLQAIRSMPPPEKVVDPHYAALRRNFRNSMESFYADFGEQLSVLSSESEDNWRVYPLVNREEEEQLRRLSCAEEWNLNDPLRARSVMSRRLSQPHVTTTTRTTTRTTTTRTRTTTTRTTTPRRRDALRLHSRFFSPFQRFKAAFRPCSVFPQEEQPLSHKTLCQVALDLCFHPALKMWPWFSCPLGLVLAVLSRGYVDLDTGFDPIPRFMERELNLGGLEHLLGPGRARTFVVSGCAALKRHADYRGASGCRQLRYYGGPTEYFDFREGTKERVDSMLALLRPLVLHCDLTQFDAQQDLTPLGEYVVELLRLREIIKPLTEDYDPPRQVLPKTHPRGKKYLKMLRKLRRLRADFGGAAALYDFVLAGISSIEWTDGEECLRRRFALLEKRVTRLRLAIAAGIALPRRKKPVFRSHAAMWDRMQRLYDLGAGNRRELAQAEKFEHLWQLWRDGIYEEELACESHDDKNLASHRAAFARWLEQDRVDRGPYARFPRDRWKWRDAGMFDLSFGVLRSGGITQSPEDALDLSVGRLQPIPRLPAPVRSVPGADFAPTSLSRWDVKVGYQRRANMNRRHRF